jgi:hypothetical protein
MAFLEPPRIVNLTAPSWEAKMWHLLRIGRKTSQMDSTYFSSTAAGKHNFRDDLRAIVGGALAFAFFAAAITGSIDPPLLFSDATWTAIAGLVGAVAGKVML